MQTVVVGAGAMGSLFAYLLHRAGASVCLLERDPAVLKAVGNSGLKVEGISGAHTVPMPIGADCRFSGSPDLVLVFVKAHDTVSAAETIKPILGARTMVVTLQNGYGNDETLAEILGSDRIIAGTTSLGATLLAPGHVMHTSWGDATVAPRDLSARSQAENIAAFFTRHGIKTSVYDDLTGLVWGRVLINAGIGPITALTRVRNGKLLASDSAKQMMREAVAEGAAIIKAAGITLPYRDPQRKVEETIHHTADNLSAMLQDLYKGRKTEVDFINGAIVRLAEKYGLEAPINRALTLLVKTTETAG